MLDSVMKGHYPCEQALSTAAFAVEKSTPIVMGSPLTLYTEHAVFAIIQKAKTTLTTQRVSGYEVILSLPSLKVVKCHTVNPATFFAHPIATADDDTHDCATYCPDESGTAKEDPLPDSIIYFVDGSSTIDQETGIRHTGAAVVRAQQNNSSDSLDIVQQITLPPHYSAQAAELVALIAALKHGADKRITVYSDSAYVTTTTHSSILRWKRRGFLKTDGTPVMHKQLLEELIDSLTLPAEVAVVKCAAHTNGQDFVSRGNAMADWAAKAAAKGQSCTQSLSPTQTDCTRILLAKDAHPIAQEDIQEAAEDTSESPLPDTPDSTLPYTIDDTQQFDIIAQLHLREIQESSQAEEKELWKKRGVQQDASDFIYRQTMTGKPVMPQALLQVALTQLHLPTHVPRDIMSSNLQAEWFIPNAHEQIQLFVHQCLICQQYSPNPAMKTVASTIPRPKGPFRELHIDYVDMLDRCHNYRYLIVVVCPFSRWIEAGPCVHCDAKAAATFLLREVICRWGLPESIRSDNGGHFSNSIFEIIATMLGIKHKLTSAYHPQSNGICERLNGLLKAKISKISATIGKKLLYCLPIALFALRNSPSSDHHLTPHQLVTGRSMNTVVPSTRPKVDNETSSEIVKAELFDYLCALTCAARFLSIQTSKTKRKDSTSKDGTISDKLLPIRPGTQIFIKKQVRKWRDPKYEGPYLVIDSSPTAVRIAERKAWVHLNHVRIHPAPSET
ncbi:uncharacterized protein LOC144819836 [Lissotriton helveticus]